MGNCDSSCDFDFDCGDGLCDLYGCCEYGVVGFANFIETMAATSLTTSLCIMIAYPYDIEQLKKTPPSTLINLCGGSDKICCFYDGRAFGVGETNSTNSSNVASSTKLIGASIRGKLSIGHTTHCSENSHNCTNYCCDQPGHCEPGVCPKGVNQSNLKGSIKHGNDGNQIGNQSSTPTNKIIQVKPIFKPKKRNQKRINYQTSCGEHL